MFSSSLRSSSLRTTCSLLKQSAFTQPRGLVAFKYSDIVIDHYENPRNVGKSFIFLGSRFSRDFFDINDFAFLSSFQPKTSVKGSHLSYSTLYRLLLFLWVVALHLSIWLVPGTTSALTGCFKNFPARFYPKTLAKHYSLTFHMFRIAQ